jgi:tetratricopeptide (TPR) repeat protein
MKKIIYLLLCSLMLSCGPNEKTVKKNQEAQVMALFNQGVQSSLQGVEANKKGQFDEAKKLNLKAIEEFKKVLEIDPAHKLSISAIGHSYYEVQDFNQAKSWFEKAIALDPSFAANHLEYGFSLLNLGMLPEGKAAINKALELDKSPEARDQAVLSLFDIAAVSYEQGVGLSVEGNDTEALKYKEYAVGVLLTANQLDSTEQEIIAKIRLIAKDLGDKDLEKAFK